MSKQLKIARRSESEIGSLAAEIARLEERRKSLGAALVAQKRELLMSTADEEGIFEKLTPDAIVAAIKAIAASTGKPENASASAAAATAAPPSIGPDDRVVIEVRFGNHRSSNVDRLRGHGLARDGKRGVWHGQVDAQTYAELAGSFGPKLTILAVHSGVNTRTEIGSEPNDAASSEQQSTDVSSEPASEVNADLQPPPSAAEEKSVKPSPLFRGLPPRSFKKQEGATLDTPINI